MKSTYWVGRYSTGGPDRHEPTKANLERQCIPPRLRSEWVPAVFLSCQLLEQRGGLTLRQARALMPRWEDPDGYSRILRETPDGRLVHLKQQK